MKRMGVWFLGFLLAITIGCSGSSKSESVTLANLNFLHGIFCPPETEYCRLDDRLDLLFELIAGAGCPDVVTLQEIWGSSLDAIAARLDEVCPFTYNLVQGEIRPGVDDETVLSRYPVLEIAQLPLFGNFRNVLQTRIDHPSGPIDVFSTHLASSADGGPGPCAEDCPAECVEAGASTMRECQAVQMSEWIELRHDIPEPALVAGDFNAEPGTFAYRQFTDKGWSDAYLVAGNPECDPETGVGCTTGREDEDLDAMETPALGVHRRIDFIFVVPAGEGSSCAGVIEAANDPDGDGTTTGLFAGEPNPFSGSCGPLPEAICWPSDHVGVQIDLECS